jgi:hypothetical protein
VISFDDLVVNENNDEVGTEDESGRVKLLPTLGVPPDPNINPDPDIDARSDTPPDPNINPDPDIDDVDTAFSPSDDPNSSVLFGPLLPHAAHTLVDLSLLT